LLKVIEYQQDRVDVAAQPVLECRSQALLRACVLDRSARIQSLIEVLG
jgi:hypothetical protein